MDICHPTSHHIRRHFQTKFIIRFQKYTFRFSQPLTDCTIRGLSEISPLCMFQMSTTCHQRDFHICNRRTDKYSPVFLFFQMGQNQSLPVFIQCILTAVCVKLHPTSLLTWFHKKMHFRIMTQWFKVSYPFYWRFNGFLIYDISRTKFHTDTKTFFDQTFQNFYLNLTHNLGMNFSQFLVPDNVQQRLLFLQLP